MRSGRRRGGFDEIADKETGNLPAVREDAVDHHVQPDATRHAFGHVAVVAHTAVDESRVASLTLRRFLAFDVALAPPGGKAVEVKDGGETGHARHDQLRTAAESDRAVGIDAAHTDLEFGFGHNAVDIDRCAVLQAAVADQVTGHEVMRGCRVGGSHVRAHLLDDFLLCQRSVGAAANDDHRLRFGHAGRGQLLQHMGEHQLRGRGPAQVIDNDGGAGPPFGRVADAGCADRIVERRRNLRRVERGRALIPRRCGYSSRREK